jgi:hypothetical protein
VKAQRSSRLGLQVAAAVLFAIVALPLAWVYKPGWFTGLAIGVGVSLALTFVEYLEMRWRNGDSPRN